MGNGHRPWARVSAPPGGAPLSNCWPVIMHAANRNDLNLLPSAVMIYDERERLQAGMIRWRCFIQRSRPGSPSAPLLRAWRRSLSMPDNIDPGRQQTLREAIIGNCRQTNHCEVRQSATAGFTFSISGWRMAGLSACIPTSPSLTRPGVRVINCMMTFYSPRSRSRSASGTGRSPATACR